MKYRKILFAAFLASIMSSASAQNTTDNEMVFNPHWQIQVQGGVSHTIGEAKFGDLIAPAGQIAVGYRFSPVFDLRFAASMSEGKGGWVNPAMKYKFTYVGTALDFRIDLTNAIGGYNPRRLCSVGIFLGGGATVAWNNGRANRLARQGYDLKNVWDGTKTMPVGRIGADLGFRLSKRLSLTLEANANVITDEFNSKQAGNADWYFNGLVGVKVALGKTQKKKEQPVQTVIIEKVVEQPRKEITPTPAPAPKEVRKSVEKQINVFFAISSSKIADEERVKINEMVAFLKANPETRVSISGYADAETGGKRANMKYSQDRVAAVKEALMQAGIAESRIATAAYGDNVQPYTDNVKNRVTIVVAM